MKTNTDLQDVLSDPGLVLDTVPSVQLIAQSLAERAGANLPIKVMYGETYDRLGPTFDSLKYYFAVALIARAAGPTAVPSILVADIASCRNEPEEYHEELMGIGAAKVRFVKAVSQVYSLGLRVIAMSEYLDSEEFQERLRVIRHHATNEERFFEWIKQTVPPSKVAIEQQKDFAYAFEEIATIIDYDIKVGPPRERFYDEPARLVACAIGNPPLSSVYMHPTFPLGVGPDLFLSNPEIETFGVTAYKAGSKGLAKNRIILGQTSQERLAGLIQRSFVSKKREVPNPVLETAVVGEMARQWIENDHRPVALRESFYRGDVSPAQLKEMSLQSATRYVLEPLQSLGQAASSR